jgi:hypothetical protein
VSPGLRLVLGGTAGLGVILAHVLAFLVAEPHSHVREELLASTGHRYWALTVSIALALFVGGLVSLVWNGVRAAQPRSAARLFLEAAPRLVPLQVIGFVLLEAAERLVVGHLTCDLLTEPVLVIGVITQVAVALVGAALIALLSRVVAALVSAIRRPIARAAQTLTPTSTSDHGWSPVHVAAGGRTLRGPPAS